MKNKLKTKSWFQRLRTTLALGFSFFKVGVQIVYGASRLEKLTRPSVSIFGGHLLKRESEFIQKAHQLASLLVEHDISVITGGGPGIMEAANSGAAHAKPGEVRSIGIGVVGLKGEEPNPYVHESITLDYFFARKYLLMYYSIGFVFFPGGIGTLDELCELLNLIQTDKHEKAPIILMSRTFWQPFMKQLEMSIQYELLKTNGFYPNIYVVDESQEAFEILYKHCQCD
jgi:uncharacterized protein (TIGR00730 family)